MFRIIVVDDEPMHRKGLVRVIKKLRPQYDVCSFKNGQEAIEFLKCNVVDVLITDIKMPLLDGLSLIREYDNKDRKTKVIILSGYADFEYAQHAISLGVFDYVLKPVDIDKIKGMLLKVENSIDDERKKKQDELNSIRDKEKHFEQWGYNKWIKGEFDIGELACASGKINYDTQGYAAVIKLYDDCEKIEEVAEDIFDEFSKYIVFKLDSMKDSFAVVFTSEENSLNLLSIRGSLGNIQRKIKIKYGVNSGVGISSKCLSVAAMAKDAYKEALIALDRLFYFPQKSIMQFSKYSIGMMYDFIDNDFKSDMNKVIISGSSDSALKMIETRLDGLNNNPSVEADNLKASLEQMFDECLTAVNDFVKHDVYENLKYIIKNYIETSCNIESLISACKMIADKMCTVIRNADSSMQMTLSGKYIEYINMNYMQDISLEQVADRFHFNASYFSKMFKENVGMTFVKYLVKVRMDKACELLEESNSKVYEIALKVGYKDAKYFNRVFKREMNISPEEYRHIKSGTLNLESVMQ